MSNFYIGQRVRIVSCLQYNGKHHIGKEGVILAKCTSYADSWDVYGAERAIGGELMSWDSRDLEPILPEGHKPSEFSFAELMDNLGVVVA